MSLRNMHFYGNSLVFPDFSGLSYRYIFSTIKTNQAITNKAFDISASSGGAGILGREHTLLFDGDGLISESSVCIDSSTLEERTFGYLLTQADDWDVTGFYDHIQEILVADGTLASRLGAFRIAEGGSIISTNSVTSIKALGVKSVNRGVGIFAMNYGNDWTLTTVSANTVDNSGGVVVSNSTLFSNNNDSRFVQQNDRRTNKLHTYLRNNSGVNHFSDLFAQQNTSSVKVLTTVIRNENDITSYYDAVFQNSTPITGAYLNDNFRIGAQRNDATALTGTIQFIGINNTDLDASEVTDNYNRLATIFNL